MPSRIAARGGHMTALPRVSERREPERHVGPPRVDWRTPKRLPQQGEPARLHLRAARAA